jgi:hypothetical protein
MGNIFRDIRTSTERGEERSVGTQAYSGMLEGGLGWLHECRQVAYCVAFPWQEADCVNDCQTQTSY